MTAGSTLRIVGGAVYDPANGIDGEVRDICVADGRIVADLPAGAPILDARGMVVMPGGVDIHSHVASSSCNHARRLLPEQHAADPLPAPRLAGGSHRAARAPAAPCRAPSPPDIATPGSGTPPSSMPPSRPSRRGTHITR